MVFGKTMSGAIWVSVVPASRTTSLNGFDLSTANTQIAPNDTGRVRQERAISGDLLVGLTAD